VVAHTADLPAFVNKPLHGALAFKGYVGMFQGALSYAVLEKATTLAGDIKPEVAETLPCCGKTFETASLNRLSVQPER